MAIKQMVLSDAMDTRAKRMAELQKKIAEKTKALQALKKNPKFDKNSGSALNIRDDIILLKRQLKQVERHGA